jgi:hypothetical protein
MTKCQKIEVDDKCEVISNRVCWPKSTTTLRKMRNVNLTAMKQDAVYKRKNVVIIPQVLVLNLGIINVSR